MVCIDKLYVKNVGKMIFVSIKGDIISVIKRLTQSKLKRSSQNFSVEFLQKLIFPVYQTFFFRGDGDEGRLLGIEVYFWVKITFILYFLRI